MNSYCMFDMSGLLIIVSEFLVTSSGVGWYCSLGIKLRQHCTTWKMERGRRLDDDATLKVLFFKIRACIHSLSFQLLICETTHSKSISHVSYLTLLTCCFTFHAPPCDL